MKRTYPSQLSDDPEERTEYDRRRHAKRSPEVKRERSLRAAQWNRDHPEARKKSVYYHMITKYGITVDEFNAMAEAQGNVCAICEQPQLKNTGGRYGRSNRLAIDHNHETDAVRGLLCNPCNTVLGMAEDSIETLEKAIAYLKRHQQPVLEAVS